MKPHEVNIVSSSRGDRGTEKLSNFPKVTQPRGYGEGAFPTRRLVLQAEICEVAQSQHYIDATIITVVISTKINIITPISYDSCENEINVRKLPDSAWHTAGPPMVFGSFQSLFAFLFARKTSQCVSPSLKQRLRRPDRTHSRWRRSRPLYETFSTWRRVGLPPAAFKMASAVSFSRATRPSQHGGRRACVTSRPS